MSIVKRSDFQAHPFHLVSPSPWPLDSLAVQTGLNKGVALSIVNEALFFFSSFLSIFL